MSGTTTYYECAAPTPEIDDDDRYRLLADEQRRTAIEILHETAATLSLADMATELSQRSSADISRGNARIRLHHVHLPMLAAAGVVEYDRDASTIEPCEPVAELTR